MARPARGLQTGLADQPRLTTRACKPRAWLQTSGLQTIQTDFFFVNNYFIAR